MSLTKVPWAMYSIMSMRKLRSWTVALTEILHIPFWACADAVQSKTGFPEGNSIRRGAIWESILPALLNLMPSDLHLHCVELARNCLLFYFHETEIIALLRFFLRNIPNLFKVSNVMKYFSPIYEYIYQIEGGQVFEWKGSGSGFNPKTGPIFRFV
jgi:hypothetical protein